VEPWYYSYNNNHQLSTQISTAFHADTSKADRVWIVGIVIMSPLHHLNQDLAMYSLSCRHFRGGTVILLVQQQSTLFHPAFDGFSCKNFKSQSSMLCWSCNNQPIASIKSRFGHVFVELSSFLWRHRDITRTTTITNCPPRFRRLSVQTLQKPVEYELLVF